MSKDFDLIVVGGGSGGLVGIHLLGDSADEIMQ